MRLELQRDASHYVHTVQQVHDGGLDLSCAHSSTYTQCIIMTERCPGTALKSFQAFCTLQKNGTFCVIHDTSSIKNKLRILWTVNFN